jgi:hypothetical protein
MRFNDILSITANFTRIQVALSDYYNGRGPTVYAKTDGGWMQIRKVKMDRGVPYGQADEDWFVLRDVRVGD